MQPKHIFYASAGAADLIAAHESWRRNEHLPSEVSMTFSGQVESYAQAIGAKLYMVTARPDARIVQDGDITIENRPKPAAHGIGFHIAELRNAIGLARTARRLGAEVALLDSGAMPFYQMGIFGLFGIKVVPILHNTIWPKGFRARGRLGRLVERLDGHFFRRVPAAIVAVSPEAARQVDEIAGPDHPPVHEIRAQFRPGYFADIPPPPDHGAGTFEMMFIGRVDETKGVLDLPIIAKRIEADMPGRVRWTICGHGPALDALRAKIETEGLGSVMQARGWTSLEDLQQIYAATHASIVPTRSGFAEGLAMTAVEAILAGRPVVTNPVVPAHELLAPAVELGQTNDAASHAQAVMRLAGDRALYERRRAACPALQAQFYDREQGLTRVLEEAIAAV